MLHFQHLLISDEEKSLLCMGKAKNLPLREAPEKCSTRVASGLTLKYWLGLEMFAMINCFNC
jgi:hypothetical protein